MDSSRLEVRYEKVTPQAGRRVSIRTRVTGGNTAGTMARTGVVLGGVQRQAVTGCGKYMYTVRSCMTMAWDAHSSPCESEIPLAVCVSAGHVGSNISDILKLHYENPGNNVGSDRRRKTAKSLAVLGEPAAFSVDDDSRQPGPSQPRTQQAEALAH